MTGLARPIKSGKSPPSYQQYYGWPPHRMSSAELERGIPTMDYHGGSARVRRAHKETCR